MKSKKIISIVIPFHNEGKCLERLYSELKKYTKQLNYTFEYIFVNDGSTDNGGDLVLKMIKGDCNARLLNFTRNFGKEMATTAGINNCRGDACLMIDADMQHPPRYIKEFVKKWEQGADVVIGVRNNTRSDTLIKRLGSKFFYKIINRIADTKLVPNSTDYRLLDRVVVDEFNKLKEHNRITRGLIDWLGFDTVYLKFEAAKRADDNASYSTLKLIKLAFNSMISLSLLPLKLAGYLGIFITLVSGLLGLFFLVEKYLLNGALGVRISAVASLAIIIVFLVGIMLICLGLISLYIANIYGEVIARPGYIIKRDRS